MIEEPVSVIPRNKTDRKNNGSGKKENLKQRAYLTTLSGMLDYVANRLTGLFVNPFVVAGLGTSLFGIWQMLGQLTGYVNIADTRASQVLKWTVAHKKDTATTEELKREAGAAFMVLMFVVPVILIAGSILAWYSPYITHAAATQYSLIRIVCALLIFSILVFKFFELFEAVLRGMNLSFKRMGLRAGIVIIGAGLKILVITLGYGLIGLASVQLLVSFMIGLSYYIVTKRSVAWFGLAKPHRSDVWRFGKLSAWYLADAGANVVNSNSDKLLLGIITSPVTVAYYTLTKFIPVAIQGFINRVVLGIMPGVGKLLGLKEFNKINSVRKKINIVTLMLTTAFGVTIIFFNHSFLNAWVGKGYFAGPVANALIIVMTIQDTFVKNDAYIISATLDIKKKVFLTLISAALFAGLGILLTGKLGIPGLCISVMASRLFLFIGQRKILSRKMEADTHTGRTFNINHRPFITFLLLMGAAMILAPDTKSFGLHQLLFYAPLACAAALTVFYFFGLGRNDRLELRKSVSAIHFFKLKSETGKKDK